MDLQLQNYIEQQMFRVAPLPVTEEYFPYGFDLQIRCVGIDGRAAARTNFLKITPEQFRKIEDVLRER